MVDLLCTSCCATKKRSASPLPAIERYESPRIRALARRVRRLGGTMVILSGKFGLLDPQTPIPWYERTLAPEAVRDLAPRVAEQLAERGARRVVFFARSPETRGWRPYHQVLERACRISGLDLAVEDAETELVGAAPEVAGRLFDLVDLDERTRARLAATGELFEGYASEMDAVHRQNAAELASILDVRGWPGRGLVGVEGSTAAWTIAQHAISIPAFQRRCERSLAKGVARGDADPRHHAHLVDRIRFNERRPQVFGTIFDWDVAGRLSPWPIEDEEGVDARRRDCGLSPLDEVAGEVRRRADSEGDRAPRSYGDRQREIEEWSRRVGWLAPTS